MTDEMFCMPAETILVVDDAEPSRALIQEVFEDEGYRVLTASSGRDALTVFEREAPDCVVLDVRMPGTDGLTACTQLRALPGGARSVVIFVTAQADLRTWEDAVRAGANELLTKPVRPTQLTAAVRAHLTLRRAGGATTPPATHEMNPCGPGERAPATSVE